MNDAVLYATLESIIASVADGVRPAERIDVAQAAPKYRYLDNPGSYRGFWDNKMAPYLVEPMEVLTMSEFIYMCFVGPARTGKSDMLFNWIAHTAKCDPADMLAVFMSQQIARDWSKKDYRRFLRHSKEIGKLMALGREANSTHNKRFQSGMHLEIKWPSINELSGKTVPRHWLADYDRMPESVDGEGSAFDLAAKRGTTFGRNAMTVAESSPGYTIEDATWTAKTKHEAPPTKGILAVYNRGDRRRWYWRCPHCSTSFEPDFKHLVIPPSADHIESAEATFMQTPCCGGHIWHDGQHGVPGKNELNQFELGNAQWVKDGQLWVPRDMHGNGGTRGEITGTAMRSDMASFWMKGPAALFTSWRDLALKYLKAEEEYERTGSQESLKTTINTDQGLPFLPRGSEAARLAEDLKSMAQDLGERVVPPGVRFLLALVDVQKSRFEVQIVGVSVNGDLTVIDRFAIKKSVRTDEDGDILPLAPATYLEDWDLLLPNVINKTYPLSDDSGRVMPIKLVGCDSGGSAGDKKQGELDQDSSVTKNAYNFWRRLRDADGEEFPAGLHRKFVLVKGSKNKNNARVKLIYPDSQRTDRHADARGEIPVLLLNSNALKDQLNVMLDRTVPGGGKVNYPMWLPSWFYDELVAESRTPDGWIKKAARNEAWDLLVYAIAMCLTAQIRLEQIDWKNPPTWADEWDRNSLVFNPNQEKAAKKQQYSVSLEELGQMLS